MSDEQVEDRPEDAAEAEAPALDTAWRRMHPDSVVVARLAAMFTFASIAAPNWIILTVATVLVPLRGALPVTLYAVLTVLTIAIGTLTFVMPALSHRYARYRVDGTGFTVEGGVLWRIRTSIPRARVQHIDLKQGPLERRYGLATLVIHTAGTQDASVTVHGLPHDVAGPIRDYLIEGGGEDDGEHGV